MKHAYTHILILCMLCATKFYSQCAIQGKITDSVQTPISFNAIGLINYKDSSIVKGVITNDEGLFCFENIRKGEYQLKIYAIGFNTYYSEKVEYDSITPINLPTINLKAGSIDLNEISVAAQKKTVEFKNGNVIMNIEGTALAMGSTAYDLLSRLPGVTVSDGNISIQGKSGVKILIDGKLQQVSGQQLINILKSMNASQIDKIEVLKKPPVKYDSEGTGGMINIKTNKLKLVGFSGSIFSDYSQGFYGNPAGGFTLNYKGRKVNLFSGFTASREWHRNTDNLVSKATYNGIETILDQKKISKEFGHFETYNLGADWFINKSNSIGIKMNGALGFGNEDNKSTTSINDNSLGYQSLELNSKKPNPWIYPEFNLNAEHLFDTTGTALRFSADYKPFWDIYDAGFDNHYLDANKNDVLTPSIFTTSNTLYFTNSSALIDFEKQFKNELKFETGIKHSYQEMLSDYNLQNKNYTTGEYSIDSTYTDIYNYIQNVSAGYLNVSKTYKKMSFQAGVRGENTIIHTLSKSNNSGFNRQYFNLFPLMSIDYKKSDNHNFSISYNKRVTRPDYNLFNPFIKFNSLLSTFKGNPNLIPEYSHDANFTYSYKTWMNHSFTFSRTTNNLLLYNAINDSSKLNITSVVNLKWADFYNYSLFIQKDLFKWWSVNLNATVFYINAKGTVNNAKYTISTTAFMPDLYSRITLKKGYSIELNAFYLSPFLEGTFYTKARSNVNITFKKTFLDEKLSIALAFKDIFWGEIRTTTSDYQNQHSSGRETFDTRRVNISINYNFGKLKVEQRQVKDIEPPGKSGK